MRCGPCNRNLNDFESTRKDAEGRYYDLCNKCFKGLGLNAIVRPDLNPLEAAPEDWDAIADEFLDERVEDDADEG